MCAHVFECSIVCVCVYLFVCVFVCLLVCLFVCLCAVCACVLCVLRVLCVNVVHCFFTFTMLHIVISLTQLQGQASCVTFSQMQGRATCVKNKSRRRQCNKRSFLVFRRWNIRNGASQQMHHVLCRLLSRPCVVHTISKCFVRSGCLL